MNRDDIIRMALKCGATIKSDCEGNGVFGDGIDLLQFAALVEAHGAAAEREACAKVCGELLTMVSAGDEHMDGVWDCINAIRARGQG